MLTDLERRWRVREMERLCGKVTVRQQQSSYLEPLDCSFHPRDRQKKRERERRARERREREKGESKGEREKGKKEREDRERERDSECQ